jgi:16S rRNA (adenine1518-N6/adenine1519-N6)-dimethyltransferase
MMENPYIAPTRVKAALRALDLHPSRSMGQNFLIDPSVLQAIVAAAELTPTDAVVEVGPGLGVLTWELLRHVGALSAVELDQRLAERLRAEFAHEPRLTIIQGDILRTPPAAILDRAAGVSAGADRSLYKVVANLPYAITSPVLRHFLEASHRPTLMVVLVQWEVAQRISAQPGDLSMLAHAIQVYAEPTIMARVPASSFVPVPAVDSAILCLRVRASPAVATDEVEALMRVIKAGFLHARKKLANALPSGLAAMGTPITKERAIAVLEGAGVSPDRRAEMLTLAEWLEVYQQLKRSA